MNILVQSVLNLTLIITIILSYQIIFQYDTEDLQHGMKLFYEAQAILYNSTEYFEKNMKLNLERDLRLLIHPDVIAQDIYAFRDYVDFDVKPDAPQFVLKQKTFYNPEEFQLKKPQNKFTAFRFQKVTYNKRDALSGHQIFGKYIHILGTSIFDVKSKFKKIAEEHLDKMQNKSEQCKNEADYTLKTYLLNNKIDCQDFFIYLRSEQYQKNPKAFMMKSNSHRGYGVKLMTEIEIEEMNEKYQEGQLCGEIDKNQMVQEYIINPILYKGLKIDFRINMVLTQLSPLQMYLVDTMIGRTCSVPYDPKSTNKLVHACNVMLQKRENAVILNWTFQDLTDYLYEQGYIKSLKWKEEYFIPKVKSLISHMAQSGLPYIHKDHRYWESFGVDIIIDEDLNLKIIEVNTFPAFHAHIPSEFQAKVVFSEVAIELVTYNLKTKFKNIRNVIKNILIPKYKEEKHIKLDKETLELARDALENIPIRRDIEKAIYIEFDEIMRDCL